MLSAKGRFQTKLQRHPYLTPIPEAVCFDMEDSENRVFCLFCFALLFKSMLAAVERGSEPLFGKIIILRRDG